MFKPMDKKITAILRLFIYLFIYFIFFFFCLPGPVHVETNFAHLLVAFEISLGPDQTRSIVRPDLGPFNK